MTLLITGGDGRFARSLAAALATEQAVRVLDARFSAALPEGVEMYAGDLLDPDVAAAAVAGVDVLIHVAPIEPVTGNDTLTLDVATRGTYLLINAARQAGVRRVILGSTLDLFEQLPADWRVTEAWRPRPTLDLNQLRAWLAEREVADNARLGPFLVICLRFGRIVAETEIASQPFDPRWLHIDDAVLGVRRALAFQPPGADRSHWHVFHITAPGPRARIQLADAASASPDFGYAPSHELGHGEPEPTTPPDPRPWQDMLAPPVMPSRPIRNVVVFGAGGPLGAVTAVELSTTYRLRLTDARPIADIVAEARPQMLGAPLPALLDAPHTYRVVDVRDPDQVMSACEGMDAIINCSVVRWVVPGAFQVNTLGVYHVMRAAQAHGIRRVVQTGPLLVGGPLAARAGYAGDYDLTEAAPPRAYDFVYHHSKYLGYEIARVFAEQLGFEVPVLLYAHLTDPALPGDPDYTFAISWEDAARALRRALEIPNMPSPFELFHIGVDLPHRKFDFSKLITVLGWQPRDRLDHFWRR
jgi:nucleoside-diphosphate-sugar epimerase